MIKLQKEESPFSFGAMVVIEKECYSVDSKNVVYFQGLVLLLGSYVLRIGHFDKWNISGANNE